MPTEATPARYLVDRKGQADPPNSEYYVMNVVQDPIAREAMAYLGRQYAHKGKNELAKECFDLLDKTLPAFAEVMNARNPKRSGTTKKEVGRD